MVILDQFLRLFWECGVRLRFSFHFHQNLFNSNDIYQFIDRSDYLVAWNMNIFSQFLNYYLMQLSHFDNIAFILIQRFHCSLKFEDGCNNRNDYI